MKGIMYLIVCIVINVMGQSSIKYGTRTAGELTLSFSELGSFFAVFFRQPFILLGIFLYAIGAMFWVGVLSRTDLSFAYPMLSISYVLILLISWKFFGEVITVYRLIGIVLICAGLTFLAKSV